VSGFHPTTKIIRRISNQLRSANPRIMTIKILKAEDLPSQEDFYFKLSLYETIEFSDENDLGREQLLAYSGTVDGYCPICRRVSTFRVGERKQIFQAAQTSYILLEGIYLHILYCTRDPSHKIRVLVHSSDLTITKIGQYPSLADLSKPSFNKYKKILGDEKLRELRTGSGLYSHGIGIGSFVYLRRVFESLIRTAHKSVTESGTWTGEEEAEYQNQQHLDKRILLLKDHLPEFLVENRKIYGILGKGIHELTEDECRTYFPVLLDGIELILNQKLEAAERAANEARTQKAIQDIEEKIKE